MGLLRYLRKRYFLLKETESFGNKLELALFFLTNPFNVEDKIFKRDFFLRNNFGRFYCGKYIGDIWLCSSQHDKCVHNYLENFSGGDAIDLGAHIGSMSIHLGSKLGSSGRVVSVEPLEENFKKLNRNIQINDLRNVTAIMAACSDRNGTIDIYLDKKGQGGTSSIAQVKGDKRNVKTITVDEIVMKTKLKKLKLIKIDVEGAEVAVLLGAKKTLKEYSPDLLFESNSPEELIKISTALQSLGYYISKQLDERNYLAKKATESLVKRKEQK